MVLVVFSIFAVELLGERGADLVVVLHPVVVSLYFVDVYRQVSVFALVLGLLSPVVVLEDGRLVCLTHGPPSIG